MSDKQPAAGKMPEPPYRTAAEVAGVTLPAMEEGNSQNGLTVHMGLKEVPNSQVPGLANGEMVSHVFGPGQNPVDPVAAGLDMRVIGAEVPGDTRVTTRTGEVAAGPRPFTYIEKTGPQMVPQAGPSDGEHVPSSAAPQGASDDGIKAAQTAEPVKFPALPAPPPPKPTSSPPPPPPKP